VPRVVADSNIYISALNFSGTADDVLALGRAGVIEIYISPAIIDEIAGVLAPGRACADDPLARRLQ
jgi:predicted nucleic acid-binding protein